MILLQFPMTMRIEVMKAYLVYCLVVIALVTYASKRGEVILRWSALLEGDGGSGTYHRGSGYGSGSYGGGHK